MKKYKLILLIIIPVSLFGLSVNEKEIKKVEPVEFEDYHGPNQTKSTHEQIVGIGKSLKKGLTGEKYSWMDKYTIIRAVDPKTDKMNADLLIIQEKARVDTIFNVRRILAGYLEEAYGYSYDNAFVLATFITYYNAVYRSDMDYFSKVYSKKVLSNLNKESAGLAKSYREWSGKSAILIPLTNGNNNLDTTNITDKKVISTLQKTEKDRGVEERKKIVEIKKENLAADKKEVKKETQEVKKKEEQIAKKEKAVAKQEEKVANTTNPEEKKIEQARLDTQKKELQKDKQEVQAKKEEIKTQEKNIETKSKEIKSDEAQIKKDENLNELKKNPDKAVAELEKTQEELKQTQNELKKEQDSIMQGKLYYLKVKSWEMEGHYDDDLVIIDPATRKVIVRSPVKRIDCNKYLINEKGIVVILHDESKPAEHKLVLLDKNDLTLIKAGEDNVFWRSFIEDRDGFIYVVVTKDDGYYLGRFTYDLQLDKLSPVKMDRDSFISFFEDTIYINREDKNIVVLNKKDLTLLEEIKP